jgi:pilus assembly protein Flp/PilA
VGSTKPTICSVAGELEKTRENLPSFTLSLQRKYNPLFVRDSSANQISPDYFRLQLVFPEDGLDLVEYALVVALFAFAATTGRRTLATSIDGAFSAIAARLTIA